MDDLEKLQMQMLKNNMKQIQTAEKQLRKTQKQDKPKKKGLRLPFKKS